MANFSNRSDCADVVIVDGDAGYPLGSVTSQNVTIANNTALSAELDLGVSTLVGVIIPATWTAADLTFQASVDGTNYFNLYDDNAGEVTVKGTAGAYIVMRNLDLWRGVRFLIIRSGTHSVAVNQGGDRVLTVVQST